MKRANNDSERERERKREREKHGLIVWKCWVNTLFL